MSRASAETSLALFSRMQGRGDVFSIHIEDGAKLAALPKEMFAEIFYPLFQWWVNGSDVEPSDPRDKMVFNGLKTHQIENAVKRGINLKNWLENASKGGRPKGSKKPSGNQAETKRTQLEDTSGKTEDASRSLMSCTLVSSTGSDISRSGLTPSAHVRPSDDEVEAAKKLIASMVPTSYETMPQLLIDSGPKKGQIAGWTRIYFIGRPFDATAVWITSKIYKSITTSLFEDYSKEDFSLKNYESDNSNSWRFMKKLSDLHKTALRGMDKSERQAKSVNFQKAAVKLFYEAKSPNEIVDGLGKLAKAYQTLKAAKQSKPLSDNDY